MKKIFFIIYLTFFITAQDFEYSLEDYNPTSPTYGLNVWAPEYLGFITLHYFSSQGWGGWTNTFGQLSDFQDELRNDDGYEDVVIIAVGQSNLSNFNTGFCFNSDLPVVMDEHPDFPIRAQFEVEHREVIILDSNGNLLGDIILNTGLTETAESYIRGVIEEYYDEDFLAGDINGDDVINVQDVVLIVNLVINGVYDSSADINSDSLTNVLDIVQIVNIIISN